MRFLLVIDGQREANVFDPIHFETGESQFPCDVLDGQAIEINEVFEPG
jgi:hypothetical protein